MSNQISAAFPFQSHFIGLEYTFIHYIDATAKVKTDHVFLLLHGNPTSSYLWRNIIPNLTSFGRCVAPDLMGFGMSGKPDINYSFQDHFKYINEFILKLDLKKITLVLHDWGGAIGFHYAKKNPENISIEIGKWFKEFLLH